MAKMTVRAFMDVALLLPPHTSILVRGDHGIGKSQVFRQLARKLAEKYGYKSFPFIDRRLAQMTEGDLIGLPSTDGNATRFNPPDWYWQAARNPCYLFLDEFNRGTQELMNGGFQIVLDYELNGVPLHEHTRVGAAINTNAIYSVNEMDPALIDRFFVVDLAPDKEDWLAWARDPEQGNIEPVIVDFIAMSSNAEKKSWLDTPNNADPREKNPSRRSWERLSKALRFSKIADQPDHPSFFQMGAGFVGTEAAVAFRDFAKNHGARFSGADILNDYKKVKSKIDRLGQERMNTAIDKVCDYIHAEVTQLTDNQGKNLELFTKDLDGELRVTLWGRLTAAGVDKIELARSVHKWLAPHILHVFNVPMGEAGIGVVPNIPGIFKAPEKKSA